MMNTSQNDTIVNYSVHSTDHDLLVGLKCDQSRKKCNFTDGTTGSYRFFKAYKGKGNCIVMKHSKYKSGEYVPCDKKVHGYVCKGEAYRE